MLLDLNIHHNFYGFEYKLFEYHRTRSSKELLNTKQLLLFEYQRTTAAVNHHLLSGGRRNFHQISPNRLPSECKTLEKDFVNALLTAYKRYIVYLDSFGADEVYLKKKVETELGTKMIHLKMRCSGLDAECGKKYPDNLEKAAELAVSSLQALLVKTGSGWEKAGYDPKSSSLDIRLIQSQDYTLIRDEVGCQSRKSSLFDGRNRRGTI